MIDRAVRNAMLWTLGLLLLLGTQVAISAQEIDFEGVTEKQVMIPMRDGKKLSAYMYFPPGDGPWPVLYEQRYADLKGVETRKSFARLAKAGYVVCGENFRGAGLSEGTWVGYRALGWGELQDGYDTVEWLAKQPWSTGKIGTFGSSQAGFAQNFLAVTRPPHLTAQYMIDTGLSLFQEGYRIGGATKPIRFKGMAAVCRVPSDNDKLMVEWFSHPHYDDYWKDEDCSLHFDKMNVPCFTIGSWYDFMCVGSVDSYVGRQHKGGPNSRGKQTLLIGPWLHGRYNKDSKVAEMQYPENAAFPVEKHLIQYFDYHLKGIANEIPQAPPVSYYVMGAIGEEGPGNVWKTAQDWPIAAKEVPYILHAGGKLSTAANTADPGSPEGSSSILSDPLKPVEIPATRGFPGAGDARKVEAQKEVLTFTTEPLAEPLEWTGKVRAELEVASTAKDTDFIVRVTDVYPDGRSILIIDMIRRARYRGGFDHEEFLEPGKPAKIAFDVGWLSQVFNRGHRIRVTVLSTGAPFYEPNPNTGEPLTIEPPEKTFVAKNTVFHNKQLSSRIIAPVVAATAK